MRCSLLFLLLFSFELAAQKPAETLPVELVYFQGYFADGKIILFWGTATEVNNYGFNIERKAATANWEYVDFVFGSGNSNSPKSYFYEDSTNLQPAIYFYRLKQIDNDGLFKYSDSIEISTITKVEKNEQSPIGYSLGQNYPNPFNPTTVINWQLAAESFVTLKLYDVLGNELAILVNETQSSGLHIYRLRIGNFDLSNGIYFYQLCANNFTQTKKMIVIK